jgi:hypothetical protein
MDLSQLDDYTRRIPRAGCRVSPRLRRNRRSSRIDRVGRGGLDSARQVVISGGMPLTFFLPALRHLMPDARHFQIQRAFLRRWRRPS